MAKEPSTRAPSLVSRAGAGPSLIGVGVLLFIITRIVVWLPLGIVGSWINGILWPILLLSVAAGAALTYRKSRRS